MSKNKRSLVYAYVESDHDALELWMRFTEDDAMEVVGFYKGQCCRQIFVASVPLGKFIMKEPTLILSLQK